MPSVWFPDDLVAIAKVPAPDPISNSAVKAFSAYGTASQDAGESVAARSSGNQNLSKTHTLLTFQARLSAGWSSPVARQAHNLKVVSSNLAPATKFAR